MFLEELLKENLVIRVLMVLQILLVKEFQSLKIY
nr:MAG TPA: hypothetical protein [Bacteriophage sp.]